MHSEGVFGFVDFRIAIPREALVQNKTLCHLKPETAKHNQNAQTSVISRG